MKRTLLLFIILFITKGIGAQTMTTHTMNDVKSQVEKALETTSPSDILVAFDIDMTLIQSDHPATSYSTLKKHEALYKKIFGPLSAEVRDLTLNLPAQFPSKLVEKETPQIIQDLQAKGIKVMALTAALTGYLRQVFGDSRIEELRHSALDGLGINFENTFDFEEATFKTIPPYRNNHPAFFKGILFSNGEQGTHNKGTVLIVFLKHAHFSPKVVIFVDDRKKNIESVEQALKENYPETQFIGIEYLEAFNSLAEDISEPDFHAFWHGLVERAKSICEKSSKMKSLKFLLLLISVMLFTAIGWASTSFQDCPENLLASNQDGSVKIYVLQPSHFNPIIEVSACYSQFEGSYLLLHRSKTLKHQPNIWGVPGGKVKKGESPEAANIREFFEETDISLAPEKVSFFKTVYITDPEKDFIFHMFTYKFSEKPWVTLQPKEHQAFVWEPFEKAIQRSLIPGEVECLRLLHSELSPSW